MFIGKQFSQAINSYAQSGGGVKQYPISLNDLILDQRLQLKKRHLRRIFRDPMTNTYDWGVVREKGRIIGVFTHSTDTPLTQVFEPELENFKLSKTYSAWIFMK